MSFDFGKRSSIKPANLQQGKKVGNDRLEHKMSEQSGYTISFWSDENNLSLQNIAKSAMRDQHPTTLDQNNQVATSCLSDH